jgi:4,5-dihydroxyphthalate decarboxylase
MSSIRNTSRRDFIRTAALAAGAASTLGGCGETATSPSDDQGGSPAQESNGLPIAVAGYKYDRVDALIDGRVPIEGADVTFVVSKIGDLNSNVISGPQTLDVTEIGLHPFMLAYANDGFRDYTLIPVFPLRFFRHRSVFIRTDRGIEGPKDLRGRVVAGPLYSSTSLTWIRGFLRHEYGVKPEDLEWVIPSTVSDTISGKSSRQETMVPEGVSFRQAPAGVDESELLVSGEVDAVIHAAVPKAFAEGNPVVGRLFPDFRQTERAYFAKTGIFPIMHAVAVRKNLIEEHPWLPEAVFRAYSRAKLLAYDYLKNAAFFKDSLPWLEQEFAETRALMGDNYWSYGIEGNRKTLDALFQYSHEQGLTSRQLTIEELFHPSTLELTETES